MRLLGMMRRYCLLDFDASQLVVPFGQKVSAKEFEINSSGNHVMISLV